MKYYLFSLSMMLATPSFAMFCPTNFNQINIGDTIQQIDQQCGKPTEQKELVPEYTGPQEWTYYVKPDPSAPASFKMTVAFQDKKVININMNSQTMTNAPFCNGTIQLGDTTDTVKKACGDPAFINKNQQDENNTVKIIEYRYNSTPPITLTFENGKLTQRIEK